MTVAKDTPLSLKTIERLVGIGRRSGGIRIGTRSSVDSIHRNQCRVLLVARNASPRSKKHLRREAAGIPVIMVDSDEILGSWIGMNAVAAIAVVNRNLASGILKHMPSPSMELTDSSDTS